MFVATLKESWLELLIVMLLVAVSGFTGYELGRQSVISVPADTYLASVDAPVRPLETISAINHKATSENFSATLQPDDVEEKDHLIVYGSINGSKYYNYGCKSGDRIKPENRIYFANPGEALLAGYEPAANCEF